MVFFEGFHSVNCTTWGAGIAQWVEHQTCDRRTWVRVLAGVAGEFSSPGSTLCADSFRYPFHPCVTAVACKTSWSFCQKCICTCIYMHPRYVALHEVMRHEAWLCGVHRTHTDGSSFMWHQSCNNQTSA